MVSFSPQKTCPHVGPERPVSCCLSRQHLLISLPVLSPPLMSTSETLGHSTSPGHPIPHFPPHHRHNNPHPYWEQSKNITDRDTVNGPQVSHSFFHPRLNSLFLVFQAVITSTRAAAALTYLFSVSRTATVRRVSLVSFLSSTCFFLTPPLKSTWEISFLNLRIHPSTHI